MDNNQNLQSSDDDFNKKISKQLPYSKKQLLVFAIAGSLLYFAYKYLPYSQFVIASIVIVVVGGYFAFVNRIADGLGVKLEDA